MVGEEKSPEARLLPSAPRKAVAVMVPGRGQQTGSQRDSAYQLRANNHHVQMASPSWASLFSSLTWE